MIYLFMDDVREPRTVFHGSPKVVRSVAELRRALYDLTPENVSGFMLDHDLLPWHYPKSLKNDNVVLLTNSYGADRDHTFGIWAVPIIQGWAMAHGQDPAGVQVVMHSMRPVGAAMMHSRAVMLGLSSRVLPYSEL